MAVDQRKTRRVNEVLEWQRQAQVPPGQGGPNYWIDIITTFFRMVRDPLYSFPLRVKVLGMAAFLYALSPIDLIPDVFFGLGFIDDVGVLFLALQMIYGEITRYRAELPPVEAKAEEQR